VFALQYRDLPADTYLCLSLYELCEGRPMLLVGCSSMPLFSKKGRLKTGQQRLQVRFLRQLWYIACGTSGCC
jgi:phosphatidylinositol 3-kinase